MAKMRKITVVGPFSVGKTSLVRRHVENRFEQSYRATLGVACFKKDVTLGDGTTLTQMIWDVEGGQATHARFQAYLRGAAGALLVTDLSRPETLDLLADYWADIQKMAPGIPLGVALNKADLLDAAEVEAAISQVGQRFGPLVRATSAATGAAVEELFGALAEMTA